MIIIWRATKSDPCPICRKDHSCSLTADGMRMCRRTHGEVSGWRYLGETAGGWGMFRDDDGKFDPSAYKPRQRSAPVPKTARVERPPPEWQSLYHYLTTHSERDHAVWALSEGLRVSVASLDAIGCCWFPRELHGMAVNQFGCWGLKDLPDCWVFPERDGDGNICGLANRYWNAKEKKVEKRALSGSKRGIGCPCGWEDESGPLLLVEGASDLAALWSCGLNALSRPNNLAGGPILAELLSGMQLAREIIVVGENDEKEDGTWPGRTGAEKVANQLAAAHPGTIFYWCLPPDKVKDVREWLTGRKTEEAGRELLEKMRAQGMVVARIGPPNPTPQPVPATASGTAEFELTLSLEEEGGVNSIQPPKAPSISSLLPPEAISQTRPSMCPRCITEALAHARYPRKYKVARLACDAWRCEVCRKRLAGRMTDHLADRMDGAIGRGRTLRQVLLDRADRSPVLAALRKAAKKAGELLSYAFLQKADGSHLLLFALAAAVPLPARVATATAAGPEEAAATLAGWSADMKSQGPPEPPDRNQRMRPVCCSSDWALRKPPPTGNWKCVGGCGATRVETVLEILRSNNVVRSQVIDLPPLASIERAPYAWAVEFFIPEEVDPAVVLRAIACADDAINPFLKE